MNVLSLLFKKPRLPTDKKTQSFSYLKFVESKIRIPKKRNSVYQFVERFIQYLVALLLSTMAVYIQYHFHNVLGANVPFLLLFSAVLLSGWVGGLGPALVATVFCAVNAAYFFLPPYHSFVLTSQQNAEVSIFVIEGILVGVLLETRRRSDRLLHYRIRQQAVISQLAQYALVSPNITYFYTKVAELITETLDIKYCKILELQPGKKTFILRGGIGWRSGLIGHEIITAGVNSQGEYTLSSDKPVIVKDLKKEKRFYCPELLMSHGIISSMSVIIPGKKGPFGILGVDSEKRRSFTNDDIYFIQAVTNIMATAIDKKSSDMELKESEIRFKRLFDSNIIGAFISNFNGQYLDANDSLLNLIGYSREELRQGKIHREILTPVEYKKISETAVIDLKTKGVSDIYEKEYITKAGKRIPVLIAVSRINNKSDICIGFVLDITKQKELEQRKIEFIGMASHELKTPITSLKVLTQFLQQKMATSNQDEPVKYLDKMNKQVDKLTKLINDLLDMTQMQSGKLKLKKTLFNLDELVQEVTEEIQSVTTSHRIISDVKGHITVFADSSRIGQVITNFITNAIKYAPSETEIIVSVREEEGNAIVCVKDFGPGIDTKYKESIFDQFFRIIDDKNITYPGMGMGLYISREIIIRHFGKIWVESKKSPHNQGSSFYFSIPLPKENYEKIT